MAPLLHVHEAVELRPDYSEARNALGVLLREAGEPKGREQHNKASKRKPDPGLRDGQRRASLSFASDTENLFILFLSICKAWVLSLGASGQSQRDGKTPGFESDGERV